MEKEQAEQIRIFAIDKALTMSVEGLGQSKTIIELANEIENYILKGK